jgi:hypothetical protein
MTALALSAALHFDFELAADPQPFERIVGDLFRVGSVPAGGTFCQWLIDVENRKAPPPAPLDLPALARSIANGGVSTAAAETAPKTRDAAQMLVRVGTTPIAKRPERFALTKCRYDFVASFGSERLREVGAQRALDAVVSFADAVGARAGAVHWAESAVYATGLASCGGSGTLSHEQIDHITDLMYWRPRWGDVIRGPAWGTFLGPTHVERLAGLARIERESGCARVVGLASGGAFLQATPLDAPLVEDRNDGEVLARIAAFLEPVMGKREH